MNEPVNRRRFLALLVGGLTAIWTTAIAALSGIFLSSTLRKRTERDETRIGAVNNFDDTFRQVRLDISINDGWYEHVQRKVVYVRSGGEESEDPVVLSAVCSHLGCTVKWDEATNEFACPCHGGRFDAEGQVVAGPPPSRLIRLPAKVRDGYVYARVL